MLYTLMLLVQLTKRSNHRAALEKIGAFLEVLKAVLSSMFSSLQLVLICFDLKKEK